MMSIRYKIRSPIDIWMAYGGDQQRIAQAMQLGVIRPEEGVLAVMEGERKPPPPTPQGTVAQQVMGIVPPPPMAPPPMGAPPAPPAPPPMAPPPQGMAMGGLASLPVPDAMFDEPTNGGYDDSYAGGGMVAFADGGDIDVARLRRALLMQESGGDYGAINAEGSGAMGAYQFMPETARALAKRIGKEYRPDLMTGAKGRSKEGRAYQESLMDAQMKDILAYSGGDIGKAGAYHFAGPNTKGHGPKTRKYEQDILRRYSGSKEGSGEIPERDLSTAAGVGMSYEDALPLVERLLARSPEHEAAREAFRARATEMGSDEYYEKERKDDMYQTLAEIGFNMASSKSPYVLQAIGEAAAAAMPGARADKKERKALKDRALQGLIMLGEGDEKKAREALNLTMDMTKTNIQASQFERELASRETIAANELVASLAATAAKNQIDPNSKQQFIQTFYDQFIEKGYSPTLARQYAYIAAEKALAKVKGTGENLFGEEEETGGAAATGSTANTLDYGSLKD